MRVSRLPKCGDRIGLLVVLSIQSETLRLLALKLMLMRRHRTARLLFTRSLRDACVS
jgi:hypothetical protein